MPLLPCSLLLLTICMQTGECNMGKLLFSATVSVHLHFSNEIIYLVLRMNVNNRLGGCLWNESWWFTWFTAVWRQHSAINNFHHADFLSHQFDCMAFSLSISGRPTPIVRWLVNGLIVDEQIEQTTGDLTENRLMWPSVQRSDLNSIFTCQAINTPLVEPRESSFVLDLHRK